MMGKKAKSISVLSEMHSSKPKYEPYTPLANEMFKHRMNRLKKASLSQTAKSNVKIKEQNKVKSRVDASHTSEPNIIAEVETCGFRQRLKDIGKHMEHPSGDSHELRRQLHHSVQKRQAFAKLLSHAEEVECHANTVDKVPGQKDNETPICQHPADLQHLSKYHQQKDIEKQMAQLQLPLYDADEESTAEDGYSSEEDRIDSSESYSCDDSQISNVPEYQVRDTPVKCQTSGTNETSYKDKLKKDKTWGCVKQAVFSSEHKKKVILPPIRSSCETSKRNEEKNRETDKIQECAKGMKETAFSYDRTGESEAITTERFTKWNKAEWLNKKFNFALMDMECYGCAALRDSPLVSETEAEYSSVDEDETPQIEQLDDEICDEHDSQSHHSVLEAGEDNNCGSESGLLRMQTLKCSTAAEDGKAGKQEAFSEFTSQSLSKHMKQGPGGQIAEFDHAPSGTTDTDSETKLHGTQTSDYNRAGKQGGSDNQDVCSSVTNVDNNKERVPDFVTCAHTFENSAHEYEEDNTTYEGYADDSLCLNFETADDTMTILASDHLNATDQIEANLPSNVSDRACGFENKKESKFSTDDVDFEPVVGGKNDVRDFVDKRVNCSTAQWEIPDLQDHNQALSQLKNTIPEEITNNAVSTQNYNKKETQVIHVADNVRLYDATESVESDNANKSHKGTSLMKHRFFTWNGKTFNTFTPTVAFAENRTLLREQILKRDKDVKSEPVDSQLNLDVGAGQWNGRRDGKYQDFENGGNEEEKQGCFGRAKQSMSSCATATSEPLNSQRTLPVCDQGIDKPREFDLLKAYREVSGLASVSILGEFVLPDHHWSVDMRTERGRDVGHSGRSHTINTQDSTTTASPSESIHCTQDNSLTHTADGTSTNSPQSPRPKSGEVPCAVTQCVELIASRMENIEQLTNQEHVQSESLDIPTSGSPDNKNKTSQDGYVDETKNSKNSGSSGSTLEDENVTDMNGKNTSSVGSREIMVEKDGEISMEKDICNDENNQKITEKEDLPYKYFSFITKEAEVTSHEKDDHNAHKTTLDPVHSETSYTSKDLGEIHAQSCNENTNMDTAPETNESCASKSESGSDSSDTRVNKTLQNKEFVPLNDLPNGTVRSIGESTSQDTTSNLLQSVLDTVHVCDDETRVEINQVDFEEGRKVSSDDYSHRNEAVDTPDNIEISNEAPVENFESFDKSNAESEVEIDLCDKEEEARLTPFEASPELVNNHKTGTTASLLKPPLEHCTYIEHVSAGRNDVMTTGETDNGNIATSKALNSSVDSHELSVPDIIALNNKVCNMMARNVLSKVNAQKKTKGQQNENIKKVHRSTDLKKDPHPPVSCFIAGSKMTVSRKPVPSRKTYRPNVSLVFAPPKIQIQDDKNDTENANNKRWQLQRKSSLKCTQKNVTEKQEIPRCGDLRNCKGLKQTNSTNNSTKPKHKPPSQIEGQNKKCVSTVQSNVSYKKVVSNTAPTSVSDRRKASALKAATTNSAQPDKTVQLKQNTSTLDSDTMAEIKHSTSTMDTTKKSKPASRSKQTLLSKIKTNVDRAIKRKEALDKKIKSQSVKPATCNDEHLVSTNRDPKGHASHCKVEQSAKTEAKEKQNEHFTAVASSPENNPLSCNKETGSVENEGIRGNDVPDCKPFHSDRDGEDGKNDTKLQGSIDNRTDSEFFKNNNVSHEDSGPTNVGQEDFGSEMKCDSGDYNSEASESVGKYDRNNIQPDLVTQNASQVKIDAADSKAQNDQTSLVENSDESVTESDDDGTSECVTETCTFKNDQIQFPETKEGLENRGNTEHTQDTKGPYKGKEEGWSATGSASAESVVDAGYETLLDSSDLRQDTTFRSVSPDNLQNSVTQQMRQDSPVQKNNVKSPNRYLFDSLTVENINRRISHKEREDQGDVSHSNDMNECQRSLPHWDKLISSKDPREVEKNRFECPITGIYDTDNSGPIVNEAVRGLQTDTLVYLCHVSETDHLNVDTKTLVADEDSDDGHKSNGKSIYEGDTKEQCNHIKMRSQKETYISDVRVSQTNADPKKVDGKVLSFPESDSDDEAALPFLERMRKDLRESQKCVNLWEKDCGQSADKTVQIAKQLSISPNSRQLKVNNDRVSQATSRAVTDKTSTALEEDRSYAALKARALDKTRAALSKGKVQQKKHVLTTTDFDSKEQLHSTDIILSPVTDQFLQEATDQDCVSFAGQNAKGHSAGAGNGHPVYHEQSWDEHHIDDERDITNNNTALGTAKYDENVNNSQGVPDDEDPPEATHGHSQSSSRDANSTGYDIEKIKCFSSSLNCSMPKESGQVVPPHGLFQHNAGSGELSAVMTKSRCRSRIPIRDKILAIPSSGIDKYNTCYPTGTGFIKCKKIPDSVVVLMRNKKGENVHKIVTALPMSKSMRSGVKIMMYPHGLSDTAQMGDNQNNLTIEIRADSSSSIEGHGDTGVSDVTKVPLSEKLKKYRKEKPRNIHACTGWCESSDAPKAIVEKYPEDNTSADWAGTTGDTSLVPVIGRVGQIRTVDTKTSLLPCTDNTQPEAEGKYTAVTAQAKSMFHHTASPADSPPEKLLNKRENINTATVPHVSTDDLTYPSGKKCKNSKANNAKKKSLEKTPGSPVAKQPKSTKRNPHTISSRVDSGRAIVAKRAIIQSMKQPEKEPQSNIPLRKQHRGTPANKGKSRATSCDHEVGKEATPIPQKQLKYKRLERPPPRDSPTQVTGSRLLSTCEFFSPSSSDASGSKLPSKMIPTEDNTTELYHDLGALGPTDIHHDGNEKKESFPTTGGNKLRQTEDKQVDEDKGSVVVDRTCYSAGDTNAGIKHVDDARLAEKIAKQSGTQEESHDHNVVGKNTNADLAEPALSDDSPAHNTAAQDPGRVHVSGSIPHTPAQCVMCTESNCDGKSSDKQLCLVLDPNEDVICVRYHDQKTYGSKKCVEQTPSPRLQPCCDKQSRHTITPSKTPVISNKGSPIPLTIHHMESVNPCELSMIPDNDFIVPGKTPSKAKEELLIPGKTTASTKDTSALRNKTYSTPDKNRVGAVKSPLMPQENILPEIHTIQLHSRTGIDTPGSRDTLSATKFRCTPIIQHSRPVSSNSPDGFSASSPPKSPGSNNQTPDQRFLRLIHKKTHSRYMPHDKPHEINKDQIAKQACGDGGQHQQEPQVHDEIETKRKANSQLRKKTDFENIAEGDENNDTVNESDYSDLGGDEAERSNIEQKMIIFPPIRGTHQIDAKSGYLKDNNILNPKMAATSPTAWGKPVKSKGELSKKLVVTSSAASDQNQAGNAASGATSCAVQASSQRLDMQVEISMEPSPRPCSLLHDCETAFLPRESANQVVDNIPASPKSLRGSCDITSLKTSRPASLLTEHIHDHSARTSSAVSPIPSSPAQFVPSVHARSVRSSMDMKCAASFEHSLTSVVTPKARTYSSVESDFVNRRAKMKEIISRDMRTCTNANRISSGTDSENTMEETISGPQTWAERDSIDWQSGCKSNNAVVRYLRTASPNSTVNSSGKADMPTPRKGSLTLILPEYGASNVEKRSHYTVDSPFARISYSTSEEDENQGSPRLPEETIPSCYDGTSQLSDGSKLGLVEPLLESELLQLPPLSARQVGLPHRPKFHRYY